MRARNIILIALLSIFVAGCPDSGTQSTDSTNGGSNTGGTTGGGSTSGSTMIADHLASAAYANIPTQYIDQAKNSFHIYYGHTSHGSQLMTGLEMLGNGSGLDVEEESGDLGTGGDLGWEATTRARLGQSGSNINVVIWSWCGGVSDNNAAGIDQYLNAMNQLEQDYPSVSFVYMTGHTDGTGANGNLRTMNKRIRDYAEANNKILYDFADIESWDPDGNYYADTSDDCGWCTTWCASRSCTGCSDCAHSHCFNCSQKGKAFWWLLARMAGWSGN